MKTYMIVFVREGDGMEWTVLESTDARYIKAVFDDIVAPLDWDRTELRVTDEDPDTHLHYDVLNTKRG